MLGLNTSILNTTFKNRNEEKQKHCMSINAAVPDAWCRDNSGCADGNYNNQVCQDFYRHNRMYIPIAPQPFMQSAGKPPATVAYSQGANPGDFTWTRLWDGQPVSVSDYKGEYKKPGETQTRDCVFQPKVEKVPLLEVAHPRHPSETFDQATAAFKTYIGSGTYTHKHGPLTCNNDGDVIETVFVGGYNGTTQKRNHGKLAHFGDSQIMCAVDDQNNQVFADVFAMSCTGPVGDWWNASPESPEGGLGGYAYAS